MKFLYASLLLSFTLTSSAEEIESIVTTMPCSDTKNVTEQLRERFKEVPIIVGKADDNAGSIMSLWTNLKTGSWTLIATKNDLSCIVGTGKSLQVLDQGKGV